MVLDEFKSYDKDLRTLTYHVLLENFNSKYDGLSSKQKTILKEFINSADNGPLLKEFYNKFYGPNNATLVLAGDFETEDAKALIEKYFGEIKPKEEVAKLEPQPVTLSETKRLFHEDNFATAPQLNMVWPTREQYTDDAYALDFLAEIISSGKKVDYVFFFEGLNDAQMLCDSKQNKIHFVSNVRDVYQEKIYDQDAKSTSINSFLNTFKSFIKVIKYKFIKDYHFKNSVNKFSSTEYNCHNDIDQNDKATNFLIQNWKQAKILTEKNGGKFFVILQPISYFDNTKMNHLLDIHKLGKKNVSLKLSTIAFYNEVVRKLKDEDFFIDAKDIFENKYEYIHIDYGGHFLPKGYNDILNKIDSKLESNNIY